MEELIPVKIYIKPEPWEFVGRYFQIMAVSKESKTIEGFPENVFMKVSEYPANKRGPKPKYSCLRVSISYINKNTAWRVHDFLKGFFPDRPMLFAYYEHKNGKDWVPYYMYVVPWWNREGETIPNKLRFYDDMHTLIKAVIHGQEVSTTWKELREGLFNRAELEGEAKRKREIKARIAEIDKELERIAEKKENLTGVIKTLEKTKRSYADALKEYEGYGKQSSFLKKHYEKKIKQIKESIRTLNLSIATRREKLYPLQEEERELQREKDRLARELSMNSNQGKQGED